MKVAKKQKMYVLILFILIILYVIDFSSKPKNTQNDSLLNNSLKGLEMQVNELKVKKYNLLKEKENEQIKLEVVKANAKYFWSTNSRVPTLEIQRKLENIASTVGLRFRSISTAREAVISENIKKVDFNVTLHCSMKEASRLLLGIDRFRPAFFWDSCTISPDSNKNEYGKVYVTGTLVTYVLDKNAHRLLNPVISNEKDGGK